MILKSLAQITLSNFTREAALIKSIDEKAEKSYDNKMILNIPVRNIQWKFKVFINFWRDDTTWHANFNFIRRIR